MVFSETIPFPLLWLSFLPASGPRIFPDSLFFSPFATILLRTGFYKTCRFRARYPPQDVSLFLLPSLGSLFFSFFFLSYYPSPCRPFCLITYRATLSVPPGPPPSPVGLPFDRYWLSKSSPWQILRPAEISSRFFFKAPSVSPPHQSCRSSNCPTFDFPSGAIQGLSRVMIFDTVPYRPRIFPGQEA